MRYETAVRAALLFERHRRHGARELRVSFERVPAARGFVGRFRPVENEPSIKGTIVKIDESTPLIKVERTQSETDSSSSDDDDDGTIDFVGASAFDILPAATVECSICRELRRSDEMNRQPCCPAYLCVICDAQLDKCYNCRTEKA